jgi:hypothetical protein
LVLCVGYISDRWWLLKKFNIERREMSIIKTDVRRIAIRELLMAGQTTTTIVNEMRIKFNTSRRTTERDITAIYKDIKDELNTTRDTLTELHIARYENLYKFYMDKGTEEDINTFYNPETAAKMLEKKERLTGTINKSGENIQMFQQNNTTIVQGDVNVGGYTTKELKRIKEVLGE